MPRDGNGNYNLPSGWPVASNTVAQSVTMNSATSDIASALTASMTRDGQGIPTADIPFGGYKVRKIADGVLGTDASSLQQAIGTCHWLTGVTGTDTITANSTIGITSISPGMTFAFNVAGNNTGTSPTLNINGLGAIAITKNGASVAVGDLTGTVAVTYNGTSFVLYSADYTTLGQLGNYSIVILNTVKNRFDDGSGNTFISGSLKTTYNTLDNGSGNATIHGSLAAAHNSLDDGFGNAYIVGSLTTTHSVLDDGTGNATIYGSLKTTRNTLDDGSGNIGIKITPSVWGSGWTAVEEAAGALASNGSSSIYLPQNAYYNGSTWVYKATSQASNYQQVNGSHVWSSAPSGTAGSAITFNQLMELDNSGNLLVGTTGVAQYVGAGVAIRANVSGQVGDIDIGHASGTTSGNPYLSFYYNGTNIGSIVQSGTTGVAYNTTSDPRLKNITGPLTAAAATAFVNGLKPLVGTWKVDGSPFCGFLTTDYAQIDPGSVVGQPDAMQPVGTLTQTIQLGDVTDSTGKTITSSVPQPSTLPTGQKWTPSTATTTQTVGENVPAPVNIRANQTWTETGTAPVYQSMEYASPAWCANMTAALQGALATIAEMQSLLHTAGIKGF